jgi:hypothetical protein
VMSRVFTFGDVITRAVSCTLCWLHATLKFEWCLWSAFQNVWCIVVLYVVWFDNTWWLAYVISVDSHKTHVNYREFPYACFRYHTNLYFLTSSGSHVLWSHRVVILRIWALCNKAHETLFCTLLQRYEHQCIIKRTSLLSKGGTTKSLDSSKIGVLSQIYSFIIVSL